MTRTTRDTRRAELATGLGASLAAVAVAGASLATHDAPLGLLGLAAAAVGAALALPAAAALRKR